MTNRLIKCQKLLKYKNFITELQSKFSQKKVTSTF
jgi:hypothetical protein